MPTITLARSGCVETNCPGVHVHEESGVGYVVGRVAQASPSGLRAAPGETVVVLPAKVAAEATAACALMGLAPFETWPGVLIDADSGVGYVLGRQAEVLPADVAAGPGEAVVAVDRVLARA